MSVKKIPTDIWTSVLGPLAHGVQGFDEAELDQLSQAVMAHTRRCVRLSPATRPAQLPFATIDVPWWPQGQFLCDSSIRPGAWLQYVAGDYAIQDAASLLPLALLPPRMLTAAEGPRVCDLCAAPGGKSAAILEQLNGRGCLLSNEVIASRVDTLQLTLARTGYDNYVLANQPIERLAENLGDQFDCVLVDAPCSGQSLVGRDKQSLSAFSTRQIEHSAARQQTILKAAVQLVRPGGRLIYSTCTFSFTENEAVMAWLCEQLPDWVRVIEPGLAAWQSPVAAGCYRLWPHRDGCHGGFAAALDRPTNGDHVRSSNLLCDQSFSSTARNEKPLRGGKRLRTSVATNWHAVDPAKTDCTWGRYLTSEPLWQRGTVLNWFSPAVPTEWRALAHAGIEVAEAFGEHWHPSYPLATMQPSQTWFQPERYVEFCDREAIGFMSGLSLPHVGQPGWAVARWRARPLSWGKQVDAQFKNHLPKPLRQNSLTHF